MNSRSSRHSLFGAYTGLHHKLQIVEALKEVNSNLAHAGRALLDAMLATAEQPRSDALAQSERYLLLTRQSLETVKPLCPDEQTEATLAQLESSWQDYADAVTTLRANAAAASIDERADVAKYLFANFSRIIRSGEPT